MVSYFKIYDNLDIEFDESDSFYFKEDTKFNDCFTYYQKLAYILTCCNLNYDLKYNCSPSQLFCCGYPIQNKLDDYIECVDINCMCYPCLILPGIYSEYCRKLFNVYIS
jgi:hypothetical protein